MVTGVGKTQKEIRPSHSHCLYCLCSMFYQNYSWEEGREGRGREREEPETQELEWRHRAEKGDRDRGERGKETETRKIIRGKRGEKQERVEKGGERKKGREERYRRDERGICIKPTSRSKLTGHLGVASRQERSWSLTDLLIRFQVSKIEKRWLYQKINQGPSCGLWLPK